MIQASPHQLADQRREARLGPARFLCKTIVANRRSFKSLNYFLLLEEEVSPLFTFVSCPGFFVVVLPWLLP
jgi:hypothetical protein